jgi:uncharacterized protein (DUF1778 family)
MTEQQNRTRTIRWEVRATQEEEDMVRALAELEGVSVSAVLRALVRKAYRAAFKK